MQTLSIFPSLFTFEIFAPLLLRIAVGIFIIYLGRKKYNNEHKSIALLYFASGALVLLGLYTQLAVLLGIVILKLDFYFDFYKNRSTTTITGEKYFTYGMAIVILLSLLVTGPGAFAFDLPL